MWSALIGDIAGSTYEFNPCRDLRRIVWMRAGSEMTDDSVLTAAVTEALLDDLDPAVAIARWARAHPRGDYGLRFSRWIHSPDRGPYGSFGNGAAMRVSPAARIHRERPLEEALAASRRVTEVTHDHLEGIKGAAATTEAIWRAYAGESAAAIRSAIAERYDYGLNADVDTIRKTYRYSEACQKSVPEAIVCALESVSVRDAVLKAISLGGDADTMAAIAGPIAEALHGCDEDSVARVVAGEWGGAEVVAQVRRLYPKD